MQKSSIKALYMKINWSKLFAETSVIVFSVFLAIYFEDLWQERKNEQEARRMLCQLRFELIEDLADIKEIIENQKQSSKHYQFVISNLKNPEPGIFPQIDTALHAIGCDNRTLYPRIATWSILLSNGLFSEIKDSKLTIKLMNYYESYNNRLVDNGDGYDKTLNELLRLHKPNYWDNEKQMPLLNDYVATTKFRAQIEHLYRDWNLSYIKLLRNHEAITIDLIKDLDNCNE